jgi:uncharacterized phage protein gp47/JayE
MTLYRKTYQEIVDELLSDLVSGVIDEAHRFEPGILTYDLNSTPVRNISSIRGTVEGLPYIFTSSDFEQKPKDKKSVQWIVDGTKPDENTTFYVNYNSEQFTSPITDRNIGSVARTMVEAIGSEISTLYHQLEKAYLSAFIDTAEGKSLEFVVSILDVERIKAGSAEGKVTFSRVTGTSGDITIPLDTEVSTGAREGGERKFRTTEKSTLHEGDPTVEVPIRAEKPGADYVVEKEAIRLMPKPIVGIKQIINNEATVISTTDESDERLRQRTKAALYGVGKATVDAIRYAALEEGATSVLVREMPYEIPGEVEIIADCAKKEDEGDIADVINKTRAAGIKIYTGLPQEVKVGLTLELSVVAGLIQEEEESLTGGIKEKITDYITNLGPGERVLASKIIGLVINDDRVLNAQISDISVQIDGFDKSSTRIMASQDILVQPKEKVVCGVININTTTERLESPPEEGGEALYPIEVEAEIEVTLINDTTKEQAENIIVAKARVYLSELKVGNAISWTDFKSAIANETRYTVGKVVLRNFHSLDGLVVILARDDEDIIRDDESVKVDTINVQFL